MLDSSAKFRKPIMPTIVVFAAAAALCIYLFLPPPEPAEAATPGTVSYTYDSLGRIQGDANSTGNSAAYTYDIAGNRTAATLN